MGVAIVIVANRGIELKSFVFPRNQLFPTNPDVFDQKGITVFRGNEHPRLYKSSVDCSISNGTASRDVR